MCALISWLELLLFVYLSNTQIVFCIYLSVISHLLFFDLVYLLDAKDLFQSKFHSRLIPTLYCVCVSKIDIVEFFFFLFFFSSGFWNSGSVKERLKLEWKTTREANSIESVFSVEAIKGTGKFSVMPLLNWEMNWLVYF